MLTFILLTCLSDLILGYGRELEARLGRHSVFTSDRQSLNMPQTDSKVSSKSSKSYSGKWRDSCQKWRINLISHHLRTTLPLTRPTLKLGQSLPCTCKPPRLIPWVRLRWVRVIARSGLCRPSCNLPRSKYRAIISSCRPLTCLQTLHMRPPTLL